MPVKTEPVAVAASAPVQPTDCTAVYDFNYNWNKQIAHAICEAESHDYYHQAGNTLASHTNSDGSVDRGLMQVNSVHADMVGGNLDSLFTPSVNLDVAYRLYEAHGWQPWSTYNSGAYRSYMQ